MIHPSQFQVNEAWLVFQLNEAPLHAGAEGDCNCLALMDAASCFILGMALSRADAAELTRPEAQSLLEQGQSLKQQLPQKLFIPNHLPADNLAAEAALQGIAVVRVPENELVAFVGEARASFEQYLGGELPQ